MHTPRRLFLKTAAFGGTAALVASATRVSLASTAVSAPTAASAPAVDFWEVVRTRRSVRRYKSDPVPDEHVRKILDAARMAPTAGNQQPWKFLVIRDAAKIRALKEACIAATLELYEQRKAEIKKPREEVEAAARAGADSYLSAPVYVIVLTDNRSKYPDYNHYDGPLAAATLMLAARALGYGTVFLTDSIPEAITRKVFAIPEHYTRVCLTPIGVPVDWPAAPAKKPLEEFIAYESV